MAVPQVIARPSPVVKQSQPTLQKEQVQSNSSFLTNSPVPLAPPLLSEDEVNSLNEQLDKQNKENRDNKEVGENGHSNNTGEANVPSQSQVGDVKAVEPEEGSVGCEEPHKENAEETTKRIQDKLNEIVSVTPINSSGPSHNCAHCGGIAGFIVKKIIVNGWIKRLCVTCTNQVLQSTFEELLALEPKIT